MVWSSGRASPKSSGDPTPGTESPVHFAHDRVYAGDARDQVGDEPALRHDRERLQVRERRRALVDADRPAGAIADDQEPQLAARRLDRNVGLAGWRPHAFRVEL